MTPQQKAKYLIRKYVKYVNAWDYRNDEPVTMEEQLKDTKKLVFEVVKDILSTQTEHIDIVYWQRVDEEVQEY